MGEGEISCTRKYTPITYSVEEGGCISEVNW